MKIYSLKIENFGNLSNFRMDLADGINTLYRENGFGKSTLAAFIKAMFYGFAETRKTSITENERKRYQPWQGGVFGGSLEYEAGGKNYRLQRTFGQKASEDTFALFLSDTGKAVAGEPFDLGRTLFGIDADGFERTVFLSERNLCGKNENQSVAEKLSDLVGTTGDIGALDQALERLEDMRKYYFRRGGSGSIAEAEAKRDLLQTRLEEVLEMEAKCEEERALYERKCREIADLRKERESLTQKDRERRQKLGKKQLAGEYRRLLKNRDEEKQKYDAFADFFAKKLPTDEELDAINVKINEAETLKRQTEQDAKPFDARLSLYRNTSPEVIGRMTVIADELEQKEKQFRDLSAAGAPKTRLNFPLLWVLAALFGVAGILLGILVALPLFGFSVIGICLGIFALTAKRGFEKQTAAWNTALSQIEREKQEKESALAGFLTPFGERSDSLTAAAREVRIKYETYRGVLTSDEEREKNREAALARARLLREEVTDFLSLFPIESDSPVAEIRRMKNKLESSDRNLRSMNESIDRMLAESGCSAKELLEEDLTAEADDPIARQLAEKEEEYLRAEREAVSLRTRYETVLSSLRDADTLAEEKKEQEDLIALHTKRLDVIQKTKAYLSAAKDSLNAAYLGGTKERFLDYVQKIGSDNAEFLMSADFSVVRSDHGKFRAPEAYSTGKRDVFALAARLALVDSLYENETPILILDDPFAHLDDLALERAKSALKVLSEKRQILYLTCTAERKI